MLVFPSNPNAGDVFAPGPGFPTWMWDGDKWTRASSSPVTLGALSDVAVADPTQGQTLTWDAAEEKWINTALAVPGLGDLADVVVSIPVADKSVLTWNGAAAVWDAQPLPTPDLSTLAGPVTITAPASGIALTVNSNSDSQLTLNTPVGQQYVTQAWTVGGIYKAQAYWDENTQTFSVGGAVGGGTRLLSNDQVRMTINSTGNIVVNAPTSGAGFTVNTLSGQNTVNLQAPAGVGAALSWNQSGRTQWQLLNDGGTDYLRFWNANSGTVMQMFNTGDVAFSGAVNSSGGFSVNGVPLALSGTVLVSWTTAEARVNTNTPSPSAYATYAIPTAGTYVIELLAPIWQSVDGGAGFNFSPYFSGTITASSGVWISTTNVSGQVAFNNNAGVTTYSIPSTPTWQFALYFKGYLVAGSAGQFAVSFSQNSATSQIASYMGHASRPAFLSVTRIR